jgi:hypothetical protein
MAKTSKTSGHLRPKDVVNEARGREKKTIGHHFEWKDAVAAEAYRLDQARALTQTTSSER